MVKAALLTPNLTMGGAEMWVVSLASSSDPLVQWTGAVVSGWGGLDPYLAQQLAAHVPVHTNDGGWNGVPDARRLAQKYFRKIHANFGDAIRAACENADILLAWGGVDPKKYAPELNIPIIQTSHTTEAADPGNGGFKLASHLAAVSEAAINHFSAQAPDRHVEVIYNGANVRRCLPMIGRTKIREQWRLQESDIAVGYLGRHSPEKYPQAAIKAIGCLPKNYVAIYYGGPTPRDPSTTLRLRDQAERIAKGRVVFRSSVSQVGDVLAGLDVFMLASRREAFSLGLIEAWLAGVPVVATPVGSLPELERRFGKLTIQVPVGASGRKLATAVQMAMDDIGHQRAERAKQIAHEHFTSEAMVHRWAEYLHQIVEPRSGKVRKRRQKRHRCELV